MKKDAVVCLGRDYVATLVAFGLACSWMRFPHVNDEATLWHSSVLFLTPLIVSSARRQTFTMCYLNFPYGYYEPEPSLRAFPRLAWAVPVSITELAASLEAYSNIHPQVHTLRLSHRFGKGPLSRIPQEILEMIVEEAQQLERRRTQPPWKEHFHCFRGICTKGQHYGPYGPHTEETWLELFSNPYDDEDDPLPLDPDDYTEDEKLAMVKAEPDTSYAWDDDLIHELHMTSKEEWLDAVCLCKSTSSSRARNWQQSRLVSLSDHCNNMTDLVLDARVPFWPRYVHYTRDCVPRT
jgi:hypothetical protein